MNIAPDAKAAILLTFALVGGAVLLQQWIDPTVPAWSPIEKGAMFISGAVWVLLGCFRLAVWLRAEP